MKPRGETFEISSDSINSIGGQVASTASANIYNGQLSQQIYSGFIPAMIQDAIAQCGDIYTWIYIHLLNQGLAIGKGLQNAANATEQTKLTITSAFHTNQGSLPLPSTWGREGGMIFVQCT